MTVQGKYGRAPGRMRRIKDALRAENERLRALLQKIEALAGSDSLEALDEAIAIAKLTHEQNVSGEVER